MLQIARVLQAAISEVARCSAGVEDFGHKCPESFASKSLCQTDMVQQAQIAHKRVYVLERSVMSMLLAFGGGGAVVLVGFGACCQLFWRFEVFLL